jgi:hypothetical protein
MFEDWLIRHFPKRKNKILNRIRSVRNGRLNDPNFISRMSGEGIFADQVASLFSLACQKTGLSDRSPSLSTTSFHQPGGLQLALW